MGEGFVRFKKKYLIDALVKALLVGFTAAMLVVAAFLMVISFGKVDFEILYSVLIGITAGLLLGLGSFFIFKMNDKRLAKRLDKDLGLNEKVQTMHAFYGKEGEINELQRKDAEGILDASPTNIHHLLKGWIVFIAVFVIALAFLIVSVVLTVTRAEEPTVNEPGDDTQKPNESPKVEFEVTDHHKIALEALIKEVESSALQDDAKTAVIAELTLLLANLDSLKYESDMKAYVVQVIKNIRGIVNTVNTTFKLHMYCGDSTDENMAKLSLALYSLNVAAIEAELAGVREKLFVSGGSRDGIESLKNELGAALKSSGIPETDALYKVLDGLYDALSSIVDHSDYSDAYVTMLLDDAFNKHLLDGLKQCIPQQKINDDVKIHVVETLMLIFGITEEDITENKKDEDPPETEEPEDRPEIGDGGFGTGETLFGSNDIVIDPEKDPGADIDSINVEYGTIISRYDAKITEMLKSGEISEELAEVLKKYFAVLITPSENK